MDDIRGLEDLRRIRDQSKTESQKQDQNIDNSTNTTNTSTNNTKIVNNGDQSPPPIITPPQTDEPTLLEKTTKQIVDELAGVNDKLEKFSELLKEKLSLQGDTSPRPIPSQSGTPDQEESTDQPESEDKKNKKKSGDKKDVLPTKLIDKMKGLVMDTKFGKMITVMSGGFKGMMSIGNKISSTLFKMSVTAAIATAKTAALIFGLIVGFDLLRIYLKYFIDWIGKKWDELTAAWGNYFKDFGKLGTIFDSIDTGIGEIMNAFRTGEFPAIIQAILTAGARNLNTIGETIRLALVKGLASVIRSLGFKDAAEALETSAVQRYADNTHGNLSEKEQKQVAQKQSEDIKAGKDYQNRGLTSALPDSVRVSIGAISQTDANMAEAEKKATPALQQMSDTERESSLIKVNEVKKMMYDYKQHANATNVGNAADMKRLSNEYDQINVKLSDKTFDKLPQVRSAIQTELFQSKQSVDIRTPQPQQPSKQDDVKTAQQIQKNQDADIAGIRQATNNTANVSNTKVVNNRTVQMQTPITGSRAPGVFGLGGIN